jgi:hypothetical protein
MNTIEEIDNFIKKFEGFSKTQANYVLARLAMENELWASCSYEAPFYAGLNPVMRLQIDQD